MSGFLIKHKASSCYCSFALRSPLAPRRLTSVQLWLWRWQGGSCVLTRSSCDNKCPLDYNSAMLITRSKCACMYKLYLLSYWLNKVKRPPDWSMTGTKTRCYFCCKTCWAFKLSCPGIINLELLTSEMHFIKYLENRSLDLLVRSHEDCLPWFYSLIYVRVEVWRLKVRVATQVSVRAV